MLSSLLPAHLLHISPFFPPPPLPTSLPAPTTTTTTNTWPPPSHPQPAWGWGGSRGEGGRWWRWVYWWWGWLWARTADDALQPACQSTHSGSCPVSPPGGAQVVQQGLRTNMHEWTHNQMRVKHTRIHTHANESCAGQRNTLWSTSRHCGCTNDELCICRYHGNLQPAVAAVLTVAASHSDMVESNSHAEGMLRLH